MFAELLNNPTGDSPNKVQARAKARLPQEVKNSKLALRRPGDTIDRGNTIIIGVASYSPDDLKLLDAIDSQHSLWEANTRILVFDVMDCRSQNDFRAYLPGVTETIRQTPVVWSGDGKPLEWSMGLKASRDLLQKLHVIEPATSASASGG